MTFQEILEYHEKRRPELWRICYPRLYRNIENYGSPRLGAVMYMRSVAWLLDHITDVPYSVRNIYMAASLARQYDFPCFFVSPELFISIANTEVPAEIMWQEMDLPFESGIFYLPRSILQHPTDGLCDFLGWVRLRQGGIYQFLPKYPPVHSLSDRFIMFTGIHEKESFPFLDYVIDAKYTPRIGESISESICRETKGVWDLPLVEGENAFLSRCKSLVFGILLAMHARPALVSSGNRTGKFHKKSGREIWEPNVIGKHYQIVRAGSGEKGTHASPRLHWRRGHYRQQLYGRGRSSIKTIWIEPMLVGEPISVGSSSQQSSS
jgi:hypothetical protein